jgi:DNA repair photolyase
MSIQAYAGEFTISPIPLEMSFNFCSHKCAYCFANLNQPNRAFDAKESINYIKNAHKSKSLRSYLLNNKYPILLSNRVGPFAASNWKQVLPMVQILDEYEIPIAWQTKGGQGIDEVLMRGKIEHWYISISFWDDNRRMLIEPGATTIEQRLELIDKLKKAGQIVSIGINPLVEQWLPEWEFEKLTAKLKDLGIKDIWAELLHLNKKQVSNMTQKEINNQGLDVIEDAKKRVRNNSYLQFAEDYCELEGFNFFTMNQPSKSNYFNDEHNTYPNKTLKTTQDFINHCFEAMPGGGEIRFDDYYQFMKSEFYEKSFSDYDGYAYRIARNVYKRQDNTPYKTLKDVLFFYWDNLEVSKSISNNMLFQIVGYEYNNKIIPYLCNESNSYILQFNTNPKDNQFVIKE